MSKNILICTECLEIGGVETVVYNQAIAFKQNNNNVFILSRKGKYTEKLEANGIECIQFDFGIKDKFETERINEVIDIINKKNINEIHVHQFVCVPLMLMVCFKTKIPYVVFVHEALPATYEWFSQHFNIYDLALKLFFQNAYKVIFVTNKIKEYNIKRFEIDENKCLVIKNSINYDIYKSKSNIEKSTLNNFLIISRFAKEKFQSIKNAIDIFILFSEKVDYETKLTIIGEGKEESKILKIIEENKKYNINYLGATSDVVEVINKNDVVFGLGRCVLEAMAIKRIAIISGYDCAKGIVTPENLELALEENLTGRNFDNLTIEEQVNQLINLDKEKIKAITEQNYEIIFKQLDINKNIYSIPEGTLLEDINYSSIYNEINKISEKMQTLKQEKEHIWEERTYFEEKEKRKEQQIETLKKEIESLAKEKNTLIKQKQEVEEENQKYSDELKKIQNGKIYKIFKKLNLI